MKDSENDKLLNIKIYDKLLDLVSRDGTQAVGSRLYHIIGGNEQVNEFTKRVHAAKRFGLTRLEVSLNRKSLWYYNPWQSKVKTAWHVTTA